MSAPRSVIHDTRRVLYQLLFNVNAFKQIIMRGLKASQRTTAATDLWAAVIRTKMAIGSSKTRGYYMTKMHTSFFPNKFTWLYLITHNTKAFLPVATE